jgi:uncharacterized coiled-coil protein SlyX
LNSANDTIKQQNQKISQKNQQLTDLTNQLADKDKSITDLQAEIANLKNPPTFAVNTNFDKKKTNELLRKLREGDKADEGKTRNVVNNTYSQEDLEKLIKEHQQEVQKLKTLIAKNETGTFQEVSVEETIRQLPKKNNVPL